MDHHLRVRVLERALHICGRITLSMRLRVPQHSIEQWCREEETIPDRVFYSMVDLILEDDIARAAQDRRADPRGVRVAVLLHA